MPKVPANKGCLPMSSKRWCAGVGCGRWGGWWCCLSAQAPARPAPGAAACLKKPHQPENSQRMGGMGRRWAGTPTGAQRCMRRCVVPPSMGPSEPGGVRSMGGCHVMQRVAAREGAGRPAARARARGVVCHPPPRQQVWPAPGACVVGVRASGHRMSRPPNPSCPSRPVVRLSLECRLIRGSMAGVARGAAVPARPMRVVPRSPACPRQW